MSERGKLLKLRRGAGIAYGAGTAFPMLSKKHGNPPFGMGYSEQRPGVVELNLDYDEAIYMLEGDLKIVAEGEEHPLAPGEALWMPRGVNISYVSETGCKFVYVTSPASPNT